MFEKKIGNSDFSQKFECGFELAIQSIFFKKSYLGFCLDPIGASVLLGPAPILGGVAPARFEGCACVAGVPSIGFASSVFFSTLVASYGWDRSATPKSGHWKNRENTCFSEIIQLPLSYRSFTKCLPTCACFKAPTSFVPSPHIKVVQPSALRSFITRS